MFWSELCTLEFFVRFLVFELWSILYLTFVTFSQDLEKIKIKNFRHPPPHTPNRAMPLDHACFMIVDSSLSGSRVNQVRKILLSPSALLTTVKYKIDHNSKTKNRTK